MNAFDTVSLFSSTHHNILLCLDYFLSDIVLQTSIVAKCVRPQAF